MSELISVIVPLYNSEDFLDQTLQSLVSQTYSNIEFILINDASTDKTVEIATEYIKKFSNIRLLHHEINKGVSAARNLGLREARGSYITFVDADDILTKESIAILYRTAKENQADLVLGMYKELYPDCIKMGSIYSRNKTLVQNGRLFTFSNPEIFSHVYLFGKLYKKELIEGVVFPEGIPYAEDQPFSMFCYINAERIFVAPSVVYLYRKNSQNDSATQKALSNPVKYMKSTLDSFNFGLKYFDKGSNLQENYALYLYLNRVLQGSVRFIFEGALVLNNQGILQSLIELLINWTKKLDDYLVLGTDSFQTVFLEAGQEYFKFLDVNNQKKYISLIRLIRDKKFTASEEYNKQIKDQNDIINTFLSYIDEIFVTNYNNICYPKVIYYDGIKKESKIEFQLVEEGKSSIMEIPMRYENEEWQLAGPYGIKETKQLTKLKIDRKKPKILLTYRDFSGCNTFALYKSIPSYITENCDVNFISGNKMSGAFVNEIMSSDIIVTTNMEYSFGKFGFDPGKIVIDLWHGFPLKTMFFEDPNYRDKNSITPYWSQFNSFISYSNLYNRLVNKCIKANPNHFLVTGAPRNDMLFLENGRKKLFKLLEKEDKGNTVLFYLPTFRLTDQKKDREDIENIFGFNDFNFVSFNTFLEENHFDLVIKTHPIFGRNMEGLLSDSSNIHLIDSKDLMNEGIDLYEILAGSDALLTDYSSVYFDYLLLDKPIIFTPADLEEYLEERGFLFDAYDDWTPGPKVKTQLELQMEIKDYKKNWQDYSEMRSRIKKEVHFFDDSNSTERVWRYIHSLITQ